MQHECQDKNPSNILRKHFAAHYFKFAPKMFLFLFKILIFESLQQDDLLALSRLLRTSTA